MAQKKMNMELITRTTFGLELEMSQITRKTACRVTAELLNTTNTIKHEGGSYDVWSCRDTQGRKYKFVYDSSIIASSSLHKCEMNSPALTLADMEELQSIIRNLREHGAKSGTEYGCGIHVHVSGQGHTAQSIRNMINLCYSNDKLIRASIKLGLTDFRSTQWCKPIEKSLCDKVIGVNDLDEIRKIWYREYTFTEDGRGQHYNSSRYHLLNLHRFFSTLGTPENTLEIRAFSGTMHAGKIKAYICLVLGMNAQALQSARILAVDNVVLAHDNGKYAMRTWLNRLGFRGDDWKNVRKNLMADLEGCSNHSHPVASAI